MSGYAWAPVEENQGVVHHAEVKLCRECRRVLASHISSPIKNKCFM
jgi:hypothetical protein